MSQDLLVTIAAAGTIGAVALPEPWAPPAPPAIDDLPGRWSRRRAIPSQTRPLAGLLAVALERCGWWRPGAGPLDECALVVALDDGPVRALGALARELSADPELLAPGAFLSALPSTTTSTLSLLWGLHGYQATVVGGALAGLRGLRHALDLLILGRVPRVVLAVSSGTPQELAFPSPDEENPGFDASHLAAVACLEPCPEDRGEPLDAPASERRGAYGAAHVVEVDVLLPRAEARAGGAPGSSPSRGERRLARAPEQVDLELPEGDRTLPDVVRRVRRAAVLPLLSFSARLEGSVSEPRGPVAIRQRESHSDEEGWLVFERKGLRCRQARL